MPLRDDGFAWRQRSRLRASAGLLLCAAGFACGPDEPREPHPLTDYNVIVINIDTLRADHVGAYGAARETSPFIDQLASEGVLFENAIANSSYTRQSVAALLTGRLPTCAGALGWGGHPARDVTTLGEYFGAAGYRTGFFSNTVMLRNVGFTRGFDAVQHLGKKSSLSGAGPRLTQKALRFVRAQPAEPFLLYLHYLDPHAPYEPPERVRELFPGTPHPQPAQLLREVRPGLQAMVERGFGPGHERFEDMLLRYDAEIRHTDLSIALLFAGLRELQLLERTAVVITSDHGEEFLEHAYVEHAWTLHREVLHVPLIFWAPEALAPARVTTPVSGVDVLPTLLDLIGAPAPNQALDGAALFRVGGEIPGDRPLVSELMIRERTLLRAVNRDDWKYIAVYQWLDPAERGKVAAKEHARRKRGYATPFELWPEVLREELYRRSADPGERENLAAEFPEELNRSRAALTAVRDACGARAPQSPADSASPLGEEEEERLRALGYL